MSIDRGWTFVLWFTATLLVCFQISCSAEDSSDLDYGFGESDGAVTDSTDGSDGLGGSGGISGANDVAGGSGEGSVIDVAGNGNTENDGSQMAPGAGFAVDSGVVPIVDASGPVDTGIVPGQDGSTMLDSGVLPDGGQAQDSGIPANNNDPCGPDAEEVSTEPRTRGNDEYGSIDFETPYDIGFVSLKTTLTVPKEASGSTNMGTLFIWPGLMPGGGSGMSRGVLQPVLTWGSSCADYGYNPPNTWWIACMYVTGAGRCQQGDHMDVAFHDTLDIEMTLDGTMWRQVATNRSNGQSVSFDIDLGGTPQWWALFAIETWSQAVKPTEDVIFTDTVMKMARSAPPSACQPTDMGATDWLTPPRISADGTTCCIAKMILRDEGVPATTPNEP